MPSDAVDAMTPADSFFAWIESSALSTWFREADTVFAFPALVVLHTLGMGLLVGASAAIDLRILGAARNVPISRLAGFFTVIWSGLWINVVSGVALLIAYPTKALTNPLFYLKLVGVAASVWLVLRLRKDVLRAPRIDDAEPVRKAKQLAAVSLALWVATIAAGRLLAYTYSRLLVS
jgi:hypothetical protein